MKIINYLKFIVIVLSLASCSTESTNEENNDDEEILNPTKEFTPTTWTKGEGTITDPFQIETPEHLFYLSEIVNDTLLPYANPLGGRNFKLMNDIDLKSMPFIPIGGLKEKFEFHGNFDGNNKIIKNLCIDTPNLNYAGLFGKTGDNTTLSNIKIEGGKVVGNLFVGGIVGYLRGKLLKNCCYKGSVTGIKNVGGLIGYQLTSKDITIEDACFEGDVTGVENIGGIIGFFYGTSLPLKYDSILTNCWAENGTIKGETAIGGIVGFSINSTTVQKSFIKASTTVTGTVLGVGGVLGKVDKITIQDCYSLGNVIGERENGGIIGNARNAAISKCYNRGMVNGKAETGGVVGYFYNGEINLSFNEGIIDSSFYGGGIVGYSNSANNDQAYITNCYNVGAIDDCKHRGGIVGGAVHAILNYCYSTTDIPYIWHMSQPILSDLGFSTTVRTDSCYYLSDNREHIHGSNKTLEEMKSNDFVTILNSNANNSWKKDTQNINNGFPVLNWQ